MSVSLTYGAMRLAYSGLHQLDQGGCDVIEFQKVHYKPFTLGGKVRILIARWLNKLEEEIKRAKEEDPPSVIKLRRIKEEELNLDANPIPSMVLAAIWPLVRWDEEDRSED